jgi:hypothetical protein
MLTKFQSENLRERHHFCFIDVDRKIILKSVDDSDSIQMIKLRSTSQSSRTQQYTISFHEERGILRASQDLSAPQLAT